jgi:MFS family permease
LLLIGIVAAEEMPAGSRAWSLGLLTMAGSIGTATCLGLLFLAEVASWRLMYAVALLGLVLVRGIGRRLSESRRFRAPHADAGLKGHGHRFWLLAGSALLLNLFSAPGSQFQNEFLKDELGYSAVKISVFIAATTIFGAVSIVVGGRLADTRGRKGVAALAIAGGAVATVFMFNSHGWPVWMWSTIQSLVGLAVIPALGVYAPELFPTSLRGWAHGLVTGTGRIGSVIGLVVAGVLADKMDRVGPAIAILSIGPLIVAVMILVAFPETARMELEDLNPEDRV